MNEEVLKEAISLTEALVTKKNIYGEFANCKIMVLPELSGGTSLIITVEDTIMFRVPMKNMCYDLYGAGSGVHLLGLDMFDQNIIDYLYPKFMYYNQFVSINLPLAQDDELRNNNRFEELLGLKASQGLKFYHLPDYNNPDTCYLFPMFAGFINLNKDDKIGVKLYDLDQINYLLKFDIYKKKINRNVEMYCRILKL